MLAKQCMYNVYIRTFTVLEFRFSHTTSNGNERNRERAKQQKAAEQTVIESLNSGCGLWIVFYQMMKMNSKMPAQF